MDRRDISQLLDEPKDEGKERASTSDSNDDREIWEIRLSSDERSKINFLKLMNKWTIYF